MASPWNNPREIHEFVYVWSLFGLCMIWKGFQECILSACPWLLCFCLSVVITLVLSKFGIVQFRLLVCWVWWFFDHLNCFPSCSSGSDHGVLLRLVCCWSATWTAWVLRFLCFSDASSPELRQLHPSFICSMAHDAVIVYILSVIYWLLSSICWVWRLVVQLACSARYFPGSVHGSCLNLDCCWKDSGTGYFLYIFWLCVASSTELRQPPAFAFLCMPMMRWVLVQPYLRLLLGSFLCIGFTGSVHLLTYTLFTPF